MTSLIAASGMGGLVDGIVLAFIATFAMPATALVAAILAWRALRRHDLDWSLVRAAAIVLAIPYGLALLVGRDMSGPGLLFEFTAMGFPEALGLLNPMAAILIAVAIVVRTAARSAPAGSDEP